MMLFLNNVAINMDTISVIEKIDNPVNNNARYEIQFRGPTAVTVMAFYYRSEYDRNKDYDNFIEMLKTN